MNTSVREAEVTSRARAAALFMNPIPPEASRQPTGSPPVAPHSGVSLSASRCPCLGQEDTFHSTPVALTPRSFHVIILRFVDHVGSLGEETGPSPHRMHRLEKKKKKNCAVACPGGASRRPGSTPVRPTPGSAGFGYDSPHVSRVMAAKMRMRRSGSGISERHLAKGLFEKKKKSLIWR